MENAKLVSEISQIQSENDLHKEKINTLNKLLTQVNDQLRNSQEQLLKQESELV